MSYTLSPIIEAQYMLLTFVGDPSLEAIQQSRVDLSQELVSHGWDKVLVDLTRLVVPITIPQVYEFAKELEQYMAPTSMTAVLARLDKYDYFRFFEDVVQNRGVNFRVFASREQALEWLLSD